LKVAILTPFYASAVLSEKEIQERGLRIQHPHPWISNLATALDRRGLDVHVVTMNTEFKQDVKIQKEGVCYNFLRPAGRMKRGLTLFESDRFRLYRFLRREGFSIVHGQGLNMYGYFAVTSGMPHILTIHLYAGIKGFAWSTPLSVYQGLVFLMQKWITLKRVKNVISISPQVRKILEQNKVKAKYYDIENPVHPDFFRNYHSRTDDFCLYVGSLTKRKDVISLFEALKMIDNGKLKIISQTVAGPYYAQVKEYVASHDLSHRVEFLGSKTNNDIIDTLKMSRFLVLPSKKEMAPMVISEAMAAGKPVIATAVDGVPYMIRDKETGFLVPPGDIQKLIEKMELLYSNSSLQRKMGMKARQEALRRWHPDVVAAKTINVYEKVVGV
jgi:glycosyltransferase involved in cell wall biosynthesis